MDPNPRFLGFLVGIWLTYQSNLKSNSSAQHAAQMPRHLAVYGYGSWYRSDGTFCQQGGCTHCCYTHSLVGSTSRCYRDLGYRGWFCSCASGRAADGDVRKTCRCLSYDAVTSECVPSCILRQALQLFNVPASAPEMLALYFSSTQSGSQKLGLHLFKGFQAALLFSHLLSLLLAVMLFRSHQGYNSGKELGSTALKLTEAHTLLGSWHIHHGGQALCNYVRVPNVGQSLVNSQPRDRLGPHRLV